MDSLNTDKVRDAADTAKKTLVDSDLMTTVSDVTGRGLELARERLEFLRGESTELMKTAEKTIRKNPLGSVAVAAGVGALVAGFAGFALRGIRRS